jgi:hypothetical protein
MTTNYNTYEIPKDGYAAFDATSLRQLIISRLNEQGTFTDQNYVGSNLAAIIDIIAYAYNTLIFYLNKTSTESLFTEAQLYENVNRIVKLIDYSPIGYQTSTLSFTCSATNLTRGLYTIPRYTYGFVNNISFSFNEDIVFSKETDNTTESLTEFSEQKLLYQGSYQEYPTYTAAGDDNETIILNVNNSIVDHFNIDVYVKSVNTNKWEQYTKTTNLFLENSFAKKYEIRLNSNLRYEIKFGNDINGLKLQTGDQVAIYYLESSGDQGVVGPNALNSGSFFIRYSTIRYNEIINDIILNNNTFLTNNGLAKLQFLNSNNSTPLKEPDTIDDIRNFAPANYRSQNRLVTTKDFETFIETNFANLVLDVKCVNNWDYISGYLKYFYDIGISEPGKANRILFNQYQYADACNFNNIYLLVIPRSATFNLDYLLPAQKQLINTSLQNNKMATVEPVFIDPVYKAVTIGITNDLALLDPAQEGEVCRIEITKDPLSRRDNQAIINDVTNIFINYFAEQNLFGKPIDVRFLTQEVLGIDGVQNFHTVRTDNTSVRVEGLSLFVWNIDYPENDRTSTTTNIPLKYFEYAYFQDLERLATKVVITSTTPSFEAIEY